MCKVCLILTSLVILNAYQTQGQTIETGSLFEFYEGNFQRNIRISDRIKKQWQLSTDFLQHTHFNANKYSDIDSTDQIKQVLFIYYKRNNPDLYSILELLDDGKHFDNKPNDRIYGNYLSDDLDELKTDEAILDIQLDTIGINYQFLMSSINYLPEIPKIIFPLQNSIVSLDAPTIYWEIDPIADGCGVILLDSLPVLGEELKGIIWEKEIRSNNNGLCTEKIPATLLNNKEYTLIIWSYTNTKQINGIWNRGAYSIEFSKFVADKLNKNGNLILSQNFPNPFNSETVIKYNLPDKGNVSLTIFDVLGSKIITLINQEQPQGEYYILWNGKTNLGNNVSSGVYIYNIRFNDMTISKKMLFIR